MKWKFLVCALATVGLAVIMAGCIKRNAVVVEGIDYASGSGTPFKVRKIADVYENTGEEVEDSWDWEMQMPDGTWIRCGPLPCMMVYESHARYYTAKDGGGGGGGGGSGG